MSDPTSSSSSSERTAQALRQQAEKLAFKSQSPVLSSLEPASPEKTRQILHELRVHQIELEMQNEELRRTQQELEATRTRYFNLYDVAPVGYCTLNESGQIVEANLTVAALLGVGRSALVMQPITRFIFKEDQDVYYLLRQKLLTVGDLQTCELRMLRNHSTPFWSHLTVSITPESDGQPSVRLMLSDVNERVLLQKQSEPTQKMQGLGQVTVVAHDFNNILTSMLGFTELALERVTPDMDEELVSNLKEAKHACERGRDLIVKLMALSPNSKG